MARKIAVEIVGDSSSLEQAFKRSSRSAQKFNGDIAKTGKGRKHLDAAKSSVLGLAGGFVGAAAITEGVKKSIAATSDLNEQIGKTGVVFKESSGEIKQWSKTTASSIGISQRQALEATGTFGNMLVPMGIARTKAAGMSQKMVSLAADMASFNNASPEDTLDALRSGLAGESEPLRKFGVFLSDARLKQEALNLGLKVGKGPLDAVTKAQATYGLILKDTKDAQGDFARTGEGWANTQRKLSALVEDLAAKLGTLLLPWLTKAANAVSDWLSKTENQQAVMNAVTTAVGVLSTGLGVLKTAFETLSSIVGGNKNAIIALVAAYATFKILTIASKIATLADTFLTLARRERGARTATLGLNASLIGKAGLVVGVGLASYELTKMALHATGLDKKLKQLGGTAYDTAAKLGLIHDPTAGQLRPPSQAAAGKIRRQAAKLEAGGLTPQQAANVIAPRHPGFDRHAIDVIVGALGKAKPQVNVKLGQRPRTPGLTPRQAGNIFRRPVTRDPEILTRPVAGITISGGLHLHGVQNPRQLEDQLLKRHKQRPRRRH